jgi:hypothetical protein
VKFSETVMLPVPVNAVEFVPTAVTVREPLLTNPAELVFVKFPGGYGSRIITECRTLNI